MLGGGDPVGVDGLDVLRVGLAAPADHEALGDGAGLVDLALRDHRLVEPARRLPDERQGHDGGAGEVVAHLLGVDVERRLEAPHRREHGERGLDVDAYVPGVHGQRVGLGGREPGVELVVDEQPPDVGEVDVADEVVDVDAAVAQRPALLVRLGDGRLEGDDALEAGLEVRVGRAVCHVDPCCAGGTTAVWRPAAVDAWSVGRGCQTHRMPSAADQTLFGEAVFSHPRPTSRRRALRGHGLHRRARRGSHVPRVLAARGHARRGAPRGVALVRVRVAASRRRRREPRRGEPRRDDDGGLPARGRLGLGLDVAGRHGARRQGRLPQPARRPPQGRRVRRLRRRRARPAGGDGRRADLRGLHAGGADLRSREVCRPRPLRGHAAVAGGPGRAARARR